MKHIIKYFSVVIAVLLTSITFAACGGDDDDNQPEESTTTTTPKTLNEQLIGNWIERNVEEGEPPYNLTFRANQTGTLSYTIDSNSEISRATLTISQSFKFNAGTNTNGFSYIELLTTSGDYILDDGTYSLSIIGDDLSLGGLRFVRL